MGKKMYKINEEADIIFKSHFEKVFKLLKQSEQIIFPDKEIIVIWDNVLKEWVEDPKMVLFARKGGLTRGLSVENEFNRKIITTDNTPAHWVFKNIVLDKKKFSKNNIRKLIESNNFPISFIRKKSEYDTLIGNMVADNETRLNNFGWKLAHINRIALKRGKSVTLQDYTEHHYKFLSLENMYLIDKKYSGLAEVEMFNEIIKENKICISAKFT